MEEDVYLSLCGELLEPYRLPWVPNAYEVGSPCDQAYVEVHGAYARLRERLGAAEEDPDIEVIIDSLLRIQRILCMEMFRCGVKVGVAQVR